jgi:replicative DNA helicase
MFSLEMNKEEQWQRLVGRESGISIRQQVSNTLTEYQLDRIAMCREAFENRLLWIEDLCDLTVFDVECRSSALASKTGKSASVIICDYIQIMAPSDKKESRERQISRIGAELKSMAKRLNSAVVAISSLSRSAENRPLADREWRLSDLREGGQLEYEAARIIGIYRKHVYTLAESDAKLGTFLVMKNRGGPVGKITANWEPEIASFKSTSFMEER